MLFNSYLFLFFFAAAFAIYWNIRSLRVQNIFLVIASYIFYACWDWRFLGLIIVSSVVDYVVGNKLAEEVRSHIRKRLLLVSVFVNLGILGFFKYFDFFIQSFAALLESLGFQAHVPVLNIVLPVGISFYTFQTMSYTIDIYRGRMRPTNDIAAFFAFVSFFPQLVAGPIERAANLLPQFLHSRTFDPGKAKDGLRQILWGFFKKVVVADTCAVIADTCFNSSDGQVWWSYTIGVIAFAMQIYGDFSGYSDIAIGTARLLGFNLMKNFAYPYFSRDVGEFWRRWHISLSTWFRDYVYIPLGGSYASKAQRIRNIIITFTVSGLWHGANWTFVIWGLLNGLYYIPLMLRGSQKQHAGPISHGRFIPRPGEALRILTTFVLICIAWVFFRAASLTEAIQYLVGMFSLNRGGDFAVNPVDYSYLIFAVAGSLFMLMVEWVQRDREHGLDIGRLPISARWVLYVLISLAVLNFWGEAITFIYFQF